jgi:glutamate/tyrosine decarboxylase-like PLP-dependent enzyme
MVRPAKLRYRRVPETHLLGKFFPPSVIQADRAKGIEQAKQLFTTIEKSEIFENVTPRSLTLVVFRLKGKGGESDAELNLLNTKLHNRLNARADTFLTQTVLHSLEREVFCIRIALGGWQTKMEDVEKIWDAVEEEGRKTLAELDAAE